MQLAAVFEPQAGSTPACTAAGAERLRAQLLEGGGSRRVDRFGSVAQCAFLLLVPDAVGHVALEFTGPGRLAACAAGGWTLHAADGAVYWIPTSPITCRFDDPGRLRADEAAPPLRAFGLSADGGSIAWACDADRRLHLVVWRLPGAVELDSLSAVERQPLFMLGTHDTCGRPADAYLHLIDGRVYECRKAWPYDYRICSENDAHTLHLAASAFAMATGKCLHVLLRGQLLLSVLERQSLDGGFHHGEWTDQMESHYRLHCSAMHLMMDALSESADQTVRRALTSAASFLARQSVDLRIGTWLLHDELEHSVAQMKLGPFRWVPSDAFGKAESNMLVLNSHLDGLVALDRYRELTGDMQYDGLVQSGREATRALLAQRSAEPLYRIVMWLVELTFLPTEKASRLPLWKRALKRLTWQKLIPHLPDIKARFPRLVMPGGYIDRELTLRTWAHDYHAINLMDLARYLRRFDDPLVRQVLVEGLAFTRRSGILQRWRELDYQKYALGFWAEALYHVCTLFPDVQYRQWLAEAMLVLEEMQMGQPPSLLGANAEAVPVADQLPCPSPADVRLRIANLGRRGAPELLVVNASDVALPLAWEMAPAFAVEFHTGASNVPAAQPLQVPARGWLWGRAAK